MHQVKEGMFKQIASYNPQNLAKPQFQQYKPLDIDISLMINELRDPTFVLRSKSILEEAKDVFGLTPAEDGWDKDLPLHEIMSLN